MAVDSIAFTMYPVSDMARAQAFYRDGLGLTPGEFESDMWTEYDVAGGTFGIGSFEQVGTPGTAQSFVLEIAELDGYRAGLASRGIETGEPHPLPNCRISVVRDPDGNQIWLHERKRG